jgi:ABC-type multidrug transport system ATPase subunit
MTSPDRAPAISIRGLAVRRGRRLVLDDFDLDVPAGQVVGLLGPSGCGKTTLMRAIVGVQQVAGGRVEVLGRPAGAEALRSRVGYVTQSPSVYADLTVRENLAYFAAIMASAGDQTPSRQPGHTGKARGGKAQGSASDVEVERVMAAVDLAHHAGDLVANLSGGERSRASLAIALLGAPELLVLDEPTVGLDPVLRRSLWRLFRELADRGVTLLVSSHVMDEAVHADRVVLMRDGRIIGDGTLADLRARTGAADAEAAFLAIVDQSGSGEGRPA